MTLREWEERQIDITPWLGWHLTSVRGVAHGSRQCFPYRRDQYTHPHTTVEVRKDTTLCEQCWEQGYPEDEQDALADIQDNLYYLTQARKHAEGALEGEFLRFYQSITLIHEGQHWARRERDELIEEFLARRTALETSAWERPLRSLGLEPVGETGLLLIPEGIAVLSRTPRYQDTCARYWQPTGTEHLLLRAPLGILLQLEVAANSTVLGAHCATRAADADGEILEIAVRLHDQNSKELSRLENCLEAARALLRA